MLNDKLHLFIDSLVLRLFLYWSARNILSKSANKRVIAKRKRQIIKLVNRQLGTDSKVISHFPLSDKQTYFGKAVKAGFFSRVMATSGSSGEPFVFVRSKLELKIEQSIILRNFYLNGFRPGEAIGYLRSYVPDAHEPTIKHISKKNHWMFSAYHLSDENMFLYAEKIRNRNIRFLIGYPSSIFIFSEFLSSRGEAIGSIKGILVSSEILHSTWIKTIAAAFPNAEITNHYGNVESSAMLTSCSKCGGFHINNDYGFLELLDNDQEDKDIVGTGYLNVMFPMHRYQTGDQFKLESINESKCSRVDPVISGELIGRASDLIELKNKKIPAVNFYTVMYKFAENVKQFQLKRVDASTFELRIVGNNVTKKIISNIVSEMKKRMETDTHILVLQVDEIPRDRVSNKVKAIL
jgi:phenylacetate-CoA ligase